MKNTTYKEQGYQNSQANNAAKKKTSSVTGGYMQNIPNFLKDSKQPKTPITQMLYKNINLNYQEQQQQQQQQSQQQQQQPSSKPKVNNFTSQQQQQTPSYYNLSQQQQQYQQQQQQQQLYQGIANSSQNNPLLQQQAQNNQNIQSSQSNNQGGNNVNQVIGMGGVNGQYSYSAYHSRKSSQNYDVSPQHQTQNSKLLKKNSQTQNNFMQVPRMNYDQSTCTSNQQSGYSSPKNNSVQQLQQQQSVQYGNQVQQPSLQQPQQQQQQVQSNQQNSRSNSIGIGSVGSYATSDKYIYPNSNKSNNNGDKSSNLLNSISSNTPQNSSQNITGKQFGNIPTTSINCSGINNQQAAPVQNQSINQNLYSLISNQQQQIQNNANQQNSYQAAAPSEQKQKPISFINYLLLKEVQNKSLKDENQSTKHSRQSSMNMTSNINKNPINSRNNSIIQNTANIQNNNQTNNVPTCVVNINNNENTGNQTVNQNMTNQFSQTIQQQIMLQQQQLLIQQQQQQMLQQKQQFDATPLSSPSMSYANSIYKSNQYNNTPINNSIANITQNNGNQQSNNNNQQEEEEDLTSSKEEFYINKNQFNFHYVIGKGGFGKVWRVEQRKTRQIFAMKEMSKALVITKKSVNSVINERNLLCTLKHPFLVNMFYAFQDRDNLYLVMDFMSGGDLRFHIGKQRRFNEEQTRFFVACIFLGLEYLHKNNIIHRDIKPENLVLDDDGYVRITDLGIARNWKPDNQNDTSGTPGYMAPEVMCRQPHTFAVDYFALGVIAFEFMLGRRPYLGRSRQEIRNQILARRVQIKKNEIPDGWSLEAADFINKLIERKPAQRLGINGPDEVKNHPWIRNFPWKKLYNKQIQAPFLPSQEDNFDFKQQISQDDEQTNEIIQQNAMLLRKPQVQSLFSGYNFDNTLFNPTLEMNSENSTSNINRSTNTSISSKKIYQNTQNSNSLNTGGNLTPQTINQSQTIQSNNQGLNNTNVSSPLSYNDYNINPNQQYNVNSQNFYYKNQ